LCLLFAISVPARVLAQTIVFNYFPPGQEIRDVVNARYKFRIGANSSPTIKILFGWHRFYGTGPDTYLIETNLYSDGIRYADQTCTTWPLLGQYLPAQGSLRVAVPDYNLHGRTGAKTLDAIMFPRQTYEIDGIAGLSKTDMISQLNINGLDGAVAITRGQIVTDKTGWKCTGTLDGSTYREWDALVTIGQTSFSMRFALPASEATYFYPLEIFSLGTEFFKQSGAIKVYLWDFEIQEENQADWRPLTQWKVTRQDDSINEDGVRLATYNGRTVIEFSNERPGPFFENGTVFDSATGLGVQRRILPAVGSTPGAGGTFFRTSVQLHNPESAPIAGRIVFHPSGLSGSDSNPSLSYSLAPGQTVSFGDLLPAMGRSGLGSADILVGSGTLPVTTARVFNDAGAAGTTGFTEEPLRVEEALQAGQQGVLLVPADLAAFRLNIGVRTLESGASLAFTVRDAAGAVLAAASRSFPATYHLQQGASDFLSVPPLPAGGSVTVAIVSGSAVVYGATVDNRTGDPSLQIARAAP
jgi:hypothetical protein